MMLPSLLLAAGAATGAPSPHRIQCAKTDAGLDYAYGDIRMVESNSSAACCASCQAEPKCVLWVKDTSTADCFLKSTWSDAPCASPLGRPCRRKMQDRESMVPAGPAPPPLPPPPPPPPTPVPIPKHFLPVYELSAKFRNWTYYTGGPYGGFVVPPTAGHFPGQTLTDTAVVFEAAAEDSLAGKFRMWYLYFNSQKSQEGYQTALATSPDLVNWSFNTGGDDGVIFKRNELNGSYDWGGVTMGCGLWNSSLLESRRLLRDNQQEHAASGAGGEPPAHKYYAIYGCYPSRAGYEAGDGGEGIAW